jgi:hypothetical protein
LRHTAVSQVPLAFATEPLPPCAASLQLHTRVASVPGLLYKGFYSNTRLHICTLLPWT